jgi:hypothetical protein
MFEEWAEADIHGMDVELERQPGAPAANVGRAGKAKAKDGRERQPGAPAASGGKAGKHKASNSERQGIRTADEHARDSPITGGNGGSDLNPGGSPAKSGGESSTKVLQGNANMGLAHNQEAPTHIEHPLFDRGTPERLQTYDFQQGASIFLNGAAGDRCKNWADQASSSMLSAAVSCHQKYPWNSQRGNYRLGDSHLSSVLQAPILTISSRRSITWERGLAETVTAESGGERPEKT